jgi:indole-3-glycerol phosphate synthase
MSKTFLETILTITREKVAGQERRVDTSEIRHAAVERARSREKYRLSAALRRPGVNVIAEIKRASPSKGVINDEIDVAHVTKMYENGGAAAVSVLTEETYFKGSLDDLRTARAATDLPILRKDFTVSEFQIYEAAAAGADAVLLIAAALSYETLSEFHSLARVLGLDALVEVHTLGELNVAKQADADLIGINNRDLHSFNVSLDVSRELINDRPASALMVAESGISSREQIEELLRLGFDGFLVGESLMRTKSGTKLAELVIR